MALIHRGKPPALPGDSPRFDLYDGRRAFLARGYFVSTVGLDENIVWAYIRNQEDEDERYE
jgi:REP element-mobilizing transposase RayT